MKKVLMIGPLPPPTGGMETVMQQMCNLNQKKYRMIPFNVSKNELIKSNIIINFFNFIYRCIKLFIKIMIIQPQLVHIHVSDKRGFWQKAVFLGISKIFGRKIILHMHGANFKEFHKSSNNFQKKVIKITLKNADKVIVLSESWKKYYSQISDSKKISVVNNAIEEIDWKKYKRIYPKDEFIFLFLSNICERKGAYDLLKAIKMVKPLKIKFIFVGPYENKERLFKEVERLQIQNKCVFVGEVLGKERFKYFASSDAFVLPSYAEGLPVAILEAMSFGLPIISTEVGAIPEVIEKNNGILIPPGDIKALKNAIIKVFKNDEGMDYNKNNKSKIMNKYTQKTFQSRIFETYETLK